MAFRTKERPDGSTFAFPLANPQGQGYSPTPLEVHKIPGDNPEPTVDTVPAETGRHDYMVKFVYDSDFFPSDVVKVSIFSDEENEVISKANPAREHSDLSPVGIEIIDMHTKRVVASQGNRVKTVGQLTELEDYVEDTPPEDDPRVKGNMM